MMARRSSGPPTQPDSPLDALYQGPLDAFIGSRKALAAALKREGKAEASEAALRLTKPSPSAWAVNQVYWHARETWNRLLSAADALRGLQERMLAGHTADPREAMAARQRAAQGVVERAVSALRDAGNPVTDATRQRVAVTVDAIAAYGSGSTVYTPGRLTVDLDPPGFAALATLGEPNLRLVKGRASSTGTAPLPQKASRGAIRDVSDVLQRERAAAAEKRRAELQAALDAAERELDAARAETARVETRATAARAAADAHVREIETHRRTLAQLEAQLVQYQDKASAADTARDASRRSLDAATARLKAAQAALERG
jgi:hypothetical protein